MRDGRYTNKDICDMIMNDISHSDCKTRIEQTQVLIIDEISMISARTLEQLDFICRHVRRLKNIPFGGLQVVLVGDFRQLKPVPNVLSLDAGEYCFTSKTWAEGIPHMAKLTEVLRQKDGMLINAIHQLATGEITNDTLQFLNRLHRPLPETAKPLYLHGRKFDTHCENMDRLNAMPGDAKKYTAKYSGASRYFGNFQPPKYLLLKKGCPVMLLKNITEQLVNGSIGVVEEMADEEVTVNFKLGGQAAITKCQLTQYDSVAKKTVAIQWQIPLTLAFATTVHKAQGMTVDYVVVDGRYCQDPGQLATAIGRVTSVDGLQLKNFNVDRVPQQSAAVSKFYNEQCETRNCKCLKRVLVEKDVIAEIPSKATKHQPPHENCELPKDFPLLLELPATLDAQVTKLKADVAVNFANACTVRQQDMAKLHDSLSNIAIGSFVQGLWNRMESWYRTSKLSSHSPKYFLNVMQQFDNFLLSTDYRGALKGLFEACNSTTQHLMHDYCHATMDAFLAAKSSEKSNRDSTKSGMKRSNSEALVTDMDDNNNAVIPAKKTPTSIVSASETQVASPVKFTSKVSDGCIRYVTGMCVAKLRYSLMKHTEQNLHNPKKRGLIATNRQKLELLNEHVVAERLIKVETTVPHSLELTTNLQNLRKGLTHVTDQMFAFFKQFDNTLSASLNVGALQQHRESMLQISSDVTHTPDIEKAWSELFPACKDDSLLRNLLLETTQKYMNVKFDQFRKDIKDDIRQSSLEVRKAQFQKKRVKIGKQSSNTPSKQSKTSKACVNDGAAQRTRTNTGKTITTKLAPQQKSPLLNNLAKNTSKKRIRALKGKDIVPKRKRNHDPAYVCTMCDEYIPEHNKWVGCDYCDKWMCKNCAGLDTDDLMNNAKSSKWKCPLC